jgi:N4-gp56 family major capsid protein
MSNLTTITTLSPQVLQSAASQLLSVKRPNLIHNLPADVYRMPARGGTTMRFRRYTKLPTAVVPLGPSGITPPPASLSNTDIDAQLSFYGQYIAVHEQVTLQNQEDVILESTMLLGLSLKETEDQLMRDALNSTLSSVNCVNGSNGLTPTNISYQDVSNITATLLGNDARTITESIQGEDRFGTGPVRNAFIALCHTDLTADLNNVANFIQQSNYPSQSGILPVEWGSVANLRFMVSSIGSITPNGAMDANNNPVNVYNIFVCGLESVGKVEMDEYSTSFVYIPPQIAGGPLALYSTMGWKMAQCPKVLNDQWIAKLCCTKA